MIRLHHTADGYRPVILCDVCQQRIADAGLAAVVSGGPDGPELMPVAFVHKGACHDAAEGQYRPGQRRGWVELAVFLLQLTHNVGLSPEAMAARRDVREEWGLDSPGVHFWSHIG